MPRLARLDAPDVLHHIMIRGIERRNIFRIKKDREDFLKRLAKLLPETQTCCYAWTLMPIVVIALSWVKQSAHGRILVMFLGSEKLEVSLTELSKVIGISVPAVGYSVERGSKIAKENDYKLIDG